MYGTATHVERLVREFRQVERLEEAALVQQQYRERLVRWAVERMLWEKRVGIG